jgi:3-oxoadipate enol-lactonase
MGMIQVGDIKLNVQDEGSGPVVLLVHGFPLDHLMWAEQVQDLARDHRVIAPDLRGFGKSSVTEGTVTMEAFADDLARLLDTLGIREKIILCGLSMGGYVSLAFWSKYADRLRAMVLADTRPAADLPEAAGQRLLLAEKVLKDGIGPVQEAMLAMLTGPTTKDSRPAVVKELERMFAENPPKGVVAALRGMACRKDWTPRLGEIHVPTLAIVGKDDAITPPADMKKMADAIPGARFVEIPDAGHMAPMEDPQAFNAALRKNLAEMLAG